MCKGTTFFRDIQDFNDFLYSHYCILKKWSFLIAKIVNKACVIFAHRFYVYSQKRHKSNNEYKRKEYGIVNQKYKIICISQLFFVPLHAKSFKKGNMI